MMGYKKKTLRVEWNLTYQCNLNCLHCSATDMRKVKDNLSLSEFEKIIEKLSPYRCTLHVNPSAGEPTIKKNFIEIYNLMAQNLNELRLTTNGIILSKMIDKLYFRNLSTIIISMDGGTEEIHDKIRGKSTYKKTRKSLKTLVEKKEKENLKFDIQINYVINKLNSESLIDMTTILDEYDVNVINVIHTELGIGGNAKANADILYLPYEECIKHIGEFLQKLRITNKIRKKKGKKPILLRPESFTAKWLYILAKKYGLKYLLIRKRSTCNVLTKEYIYLDPRGNAFPCLFFTERTVQKEIINRYGMFAPPNILEENIEEILTSKFFKNARSLIEDFLNFNNLPCKQCQFLNACTICPIYANLWGIENECF